MSRPGRTRLLWRALVPVAAAGAGLLLVSSAVTARGTDLRSSRTLQLGELVQRQQQTLAELSQEAADLRGRISAATAQAALGSRRVRAAEAAAGRYAAAAGLTAVTGPAVTVSLDDVPRSEQQRDLDAGAQPDDLVIHQQDVQGVANALWSGGATAMTIMGQRVVATTAIRCVGNTLLLHDRVYSPPFVLTAIGDPSRLRRALAADPDVQVFQQYVAAYGLRYRVTTGRATLPPYSGPLELTHADNAS
ncbi:MAG TPA: DUF881 domain-containing protein [Mycobacteriales bacterium]|nr:DUF881 domain-containing protein [Mycobacteriales bacterium]